MWVQYAPMDFHPSYRFLRNSFWFFASNVQIFARSYPSFFLLPLFHCLYCEGQAIPYVHLTHLNVLIRSSVQSGVFTLSKVSTCAGLHYTVLPLHGPEGIPYQSLSIQCLSHSGEHASIIIRPNIRHCYKLYPVQRRQRLSVPFIYVETPTEADWKTPGILGTTHLVLHMSTVKVEKL